MTEKRVLCFGDSNTWGSIPATGKRHPRGVRWVSRLGQVLGEEWDVVSEGLSGRTATGLDPVMRLNSAYDDLSVALRSHKPIDHVVLMLGTNDFKRRFGLSEFDIAAGLAHLIDLVLKSDEVVGDDASRLILVAPLSIRLDGALDPDQRDRRRLEFSDAVGISERLPSRLALLAEEKGCAFLDPNATLQASEVDAIHWDAETHIAFAELVASQLKN
ncbi:GDSL-type esterase/lipase family protein [Cognatishimia maritima]|uniref:Lysophospholipase L1 n=1 Tax=Cognatishimia maritima TaxID=870908 RepID=A0A1M5VB09_9RHOB|nr:GDSL-type esterase/lipase family protein [Cognatishimia maritima]SHH72405.1 Lysophospholipase L1 [Cognatishimia maritima]